MELRAFECAGHIVTVSEELREELKRYGINADKITTIPNGVDVERFSKVKSLAGHRESGNQIVVGFIGSLKPWHDIASMLRSFQSLVDDDRFHFLVVGDGPEMKRIRKFQVDFPDRITVTGALGHESVPEELGKMDIALAPYPEMDNFYFSPLKILEYMAAGRSIVGSDIGQVGSLLDHGRNGLLTAPGKDTEMTAAIIKLADDDKIRKSLGKQAARTAFEQHDWKNRVKDMLAIGKSLGA